MQSFKEIWLVDFEYRSTDGEPVEPVCMVARELRSGQLIRMWADELQQALTPPFSIDESALFVAYATHAEFNCFQVLGWPMPARILDLYVEYRAKVNGLGGSVSLLSALRAYSLSAMDEGLKAAMRDLVLYGAPYSAEDREKILDYCQEDVDALARLLPSMEPEIDMARALLRGRYMWAVAAMEYTGVPIDMPALDLLREHWDAIKGKLVERIDADYGVYDGISFRSVLFAEYLAREGIDWPRLPSGALELKDDVFKEQAAIYPKLRPLRELRKTLAQMRLNKLAVGSDGRARCSLMPFGTVTGRNAPSTSKFIFGPAAWLRSLIKPPEGHGLAYIDWSSQELGIAAVLSGDPHLIEAYQSGDPYLAFGRRAGVVPPNATKETHRAEREQLKTCVLATNYGQGAKSLAQALNRPEIEIRDLLRQHHKTYETFWHWSLGARDRGVLKGVIHSEFLWPLHVTENTNPRTLGNFPVQSNAAEMLRLACCLGVERGIEICAPVHDALLIAAPLDRLDQQVRTMREAMAEASRVVLKGFELNTDVTVVRHPERYRDDRAGGMWEMVMELAEESAG